MTKPDITLEPSKGIISEMAARIYSAYIVRGEIRDSEETKWMERSIREAVRIAKTVEASIETDDAPAGAEDSPTPSGEGSATKSELDGVIDEALSGKDVPARKLKD